MEVLLRAFVLFWTVRCSTVAHNQHQQYYRGLSQREQRFNGTSHVILQNQGFNGYDQRMPHTHGYNSPHKVISQNQRYNGLDQENSYNHRFIPDQGNSYKHGYNGPYQIISYNHGINSHTQAITFDPRLNDPVQAAPYDQRISEPEQRLPYKMKLEDLPQRGHYGQSYFEPEERIPYYDQRISESEQRLPYKLKLENFAQRGYYGQRYFEPEEKIPYYDQTISEPEQRLPHKLKLENFAQRGHYGQSYFEPEERIPYYDQMTNRPEHRIPYDQTINRPQQSTPYDHHSYHITTEPVNSMPFCPVYGVPEPFPLTPTLFGPKERRPFDYLYNGTKQKRPWDRRLYAYSGPPFVNPSAVASGGHGYTEPNNPCDPFEPPKQDFRRMGLRASRAVAACDEYIKDIRIQDERRRRKLECDKKMAEEALKKMGPDAKVGSGAGHIGGVTAMPMEFPHMGAVGWRRTNGSWLFKCGSSLISPKFVLTAAHCNVSGPDNTLADLAPKIIRFGTINLNSISEKYDAKIFSTISYPNYAAPFRDHDIALMELQNAVMFTDSVRPACLWYEYDTSPLGDIGSFSGWGVLERDSDKLSATLQAGELNIIEVDECNMLLEDFISSQWDGVTEYQICAGTKYGGADTAEGDSGGPMQVKISVRSKFLYYIIGVTAFGFGSALPNIPGVYTRVASYLNWIESIVWP